MPLFEVETTSHIMIACVEDEQAARAFAATHYPIEEIIRVSHRPRDAWVISKKLLGIQDRGRSVLDRSRLPVESTGRQAARDAALHANDGKRPGRRAQGDRVEHGPGLVIRGCRPGSTQARNALPAQCDRDRRCIAGIAAVAFRWPVPPRRVRNIAGSTRRTPEHGVRLASMPGACETGAGPCPRAAAGCSPP